MYEQDCRLPVPLLTPALPDRHTFSPGSPWFLGTPIST